MVKPATMYDVVAVGEAGFESQQELPRQVVLVQLQARRIGVISARLTCFEGIMAEGELSVTQLHDELGALQTEGD